MLNSNPDKEQIFKLLKTDKITKIEIFDSLPSTNTYLKEKARGGEKGYMLVIAKEQTAGRGRMNRKFYSPGGKGLYMSLLLHPEISSEKSLYITTAAAVAVSEVLEKHSEKKMHIKWVNDIICGGKKVCGILCESSFSSLTSGLEYAVLGIGINLFPPENGFPEDIANIAGAVFENRDYDINQLTADIINLFFAFYNNIENKSFLREYKSRSFLNGKNILILSDNEKEKAKALYIDDDFGLCVKTEEGIEKILKFGEVSVLYDR